MSRKHLLVASKASKFSDKNKLCCLCIGDKKGVETFLSALGGEAKEELKKGSLVILKSDYKNNASAVVHEDLESGEVSILFEDKESIEEITKIFKNEVLPEIYKKEMRKEALQNTLILAI